MWAGRQRDIFIFNDIHYYFPFVAKKSLLSAPFSPPFKDKNSSTCRKESDTIEGFYKMIDFSPIYLITEYFVGTFITKPNFRLALWWGMRSLPPRSFETWFTINPEISIWKRKIWWRISHLDMAKESSIIDFIFLLLFELKV